MTSLPSPSWWRLEIEPSGDLEESLIWRLETLGISRVAIQFKPEQPNHRTLVAWLPAVDWPDGERMRLGEALAAMAEPFAAVLPPLSWQQQAEEDWSHSWKRHWQPDPVGERLLILPAWLECPEEFSNRQVLLLDPGSAFGTGSHPTTRLCMQSLERLPLAGGLVADLGCGSGILGLAALALGAGSVVATDIDSLAILATNTNANLNGMGELLQVRLGSAPELKQLLGHGRAQVLVCNILAPVLAELAPWFEQLIAQEGVGLLSGLLVEQVEPLAQQLKTMGWQCHLAAEQSRWALLEIRR
ncbi:50S ribosomal protein L11 methyltransferase [Synechococcus sp. UW140]|uniref:50S ribosomal protein L11 methyltransferase n=1 Tax=Synechococcus sp. UW140 TaxID=368503 RepID=UPI003137B94D